MYAEGTAGVVVEAISTVSIAALTMGGAGVVGTGANVTVSLAGAGSGNTITNTVEARLVRSQISTSGALRVEARDVSAITADAGGVAIAITVTGNKPSGASLGAAIGLSIAINLIANDVLAGISDASEVLAFGVQVLATSIPTIKALTLSGTAAVQAASSSGGAFSASLAGAGCGLGQLRRQPGGSGHRRPVRGVQRRRRRWSGPDCHRPPAERRPSTPRPTA